MALPPWLFALARLGDAVAAGLGPLSHARVQPQVDEQQVSQVLRGGMRRGAVLPSRVARLVVLQGAAAAQGPEALLMAALAPCAGSTHGARWTGAMLMQNLRTPRKAKVSARASAVRRFLICPTSGRSMLMKRPARRWASADSSGRSRSMSPCGQALAAWRRAISNKTEEQRNNRQHRSLSSRLAAKRSRKHWLLRRTRACTWPLSPEPVPPAHPAGPRRRTAR